MFTVHITRTIAPKLTQYTNQLPVEDENDRLSDLYCNDTTKNDRSPTISTQERSLLNPTYGTIFYCSRSLFCCNYNLQKRSLLNNKNDRSQTISTQDRSLLNPTYRTVFYFSRSLFCCNDNPQKRSLLNNKNDRFPTALIYQNDRSSTFSNHQTIAPSSSTKRSLLV